MTNSIHPATEIGDVVLKVRNLEISAQFYKNVVGLKVLKEGLNSIHFTADGLNTLLILEHYPQAIVNLRKKTTGLYHFAILVPTRKALGLSLRNLIASGIHIGQADHLVSEALYISDPENNGIEIYCDRPSESWKRDAAGTILMAADPIDWDGLLAEAGSDPWEGLPAGTTIGHIHLHVSNLKSTRAFYVDKLGFDVVLQYGPSALFISAGGYHHHIGLNTWAGEGAPQPDANATGLNYYTLLVANQEILDALVQGLKESGVAVQEQTSGIFLHDPSNNRIRLAVRSGA
ncbi:VOC family protein [Paenibacillus eucommiae]|uniref:Catechol 2,3-dioxygenase n=1 Tax=Paenibacillus eucommiae TaxID=1355755 RepID=A0ABS4J5S7_9BACL|nr:VOC family protein [Paenibacillus eucommiae]MBP1995143.1 catechol 2,3-dioxygenase [Paenibacillus eucommiae]